MLANPEAWQSVAEAARRVCRFLQLRWLEDQATENAAITVDIQTATQRAEAARRQARFVRSSGIYKAAFGPGSIGRQLGELRPEKRVWGFPNFPVAPPNPTHSSTRLGKNNRHVATTIPHHSSLLA
uniref:Uncharacterized protein n=1 Tax=Anopheles maculatus TaxID=74869 RepID=A0A182S8U4_9DIPT